jgi:cytochrome c oxidase subunit 2
MFPFKFWRLIETYNFVFSIWRRLAFNRIVVRKNHASIRELVWTLIPTFILLMIAIPSLELLYLMDLLTSISPVYTFKVIGHQWYWSYELFGLDFNKDMYEVVEFDSYMLPEADTKAISGLRLLEVDNVLILPTDVNIHLLVTSPYVLHSWAVPSLGVKIDAVPGRINHICLFIKRAGIFYGQCSEICGVNHGFMPIKVESINLR